MGSLSLFMPNIHSFDKEPYSLQVPRAIMYRLRKFAKSQNMHISEVLVPMIAHAVKDIRLTPEEEMVIDNATENARRNPNPSGRKATPFPKLRRSPD